MLTHTFSSPNIDEARNKDEIRNNSGKIIELINLSLELDATDPTEQQNEPSEVTEYGLHPALATLESIMLSQAKTERIASSFVLFSWGPNRIIPVMLENMRILEESFDRNLNPIRVKIELIMRVLNLSEFRKDAFGYNLCLSHLNRRKLFTKLTFKNKKSHDFVKDISRYATNGNKTRKIKGNSI